MFLNKCKCSLILLYSTLCLGERVNLKNYWLRAFKNSLKSKLFVRVILLVFLSRKTIVIKTLPWALRMCHANKPAVKM